MPPARFGPAVPASERSQIHVLDRVAGGVVVVVGGGGGGGGGGGDVM